MEQRGKRTPVLIISHDAVGARMAGPGIRYYHLARVLSEEFDVTLAIPDGDGGIDFPSEHLDVARYGRGDWESVDVLVRQAAVAILPSDIAGDFPQLSQCTAFIVIDGYDPLLAEWLFLTQSLSLADQQEYWSSRVVDLNQQYLLGDFFICASERQRDWWLGLLEANGRINGYTFREDPSLRSLVDTVPFGVPESPPRHTRQVIKGVWPGIGERDRVLLWGGGLWPWLDPLTAIRAVAEAWSHRQDVRLVFPGTKHPNPWMANVPTHNDAARREAERLGLLNKGVFFGDWVPYADWPNVLLESDVALTLHYETLETRLAFRSRVLDCIWGQLPVVATRGDETSALVERHQLGRVVDYEDVQGVAEAILELLSVPRESFQEGFERARQELTWEEAARPLAAFCRQPRRAPDKRALGDRLGNPYYVREITSLRNLVEGYEQGRFIRMMNYLNRLLDRVRGAGK